MKNIVRNILVISLYLVFSCCFIFAQDTISSSDELKDILTEKDVTNFIKNFNKIQKVLDEVDYEFDDSMTDFAVLDTYKTVDKELEILGISGPHRFYKIYVISLCASLLEYEKELESDPETAQMLKLYGIDPTAQLRAMVGSKDLAIVKKYQSQIVNIIDIDE